MNISTLPDGSRGFDANRRISPALAREAVASGYRFVMRYVRRGAPNDHDLIPGEVAACLQGGLGVGVVQHVAREGWAPTPALGTNYGVVAADECRGIGIPTGVTVWCDLEGIKPGTPAADVIGFCNNWHRKVAEAGFHPGLYVGWHAGLTAVQLFRNLRFNAYWGAYNLNRDQVPAVRGVQMRQLVATLEDLIGDLTNQTMDVDIVEADALGGTPTFLLP